MLHTLTHQRLDPVFIVGHGRSGTSILTNLIRKHLDIAFGTESQFIVRYHRRLHRYGDLTDRNNLRRLVHDISQERYFVRSAKYGFQLDPERAIQEASPATYVGVLEAIFGQLADSQQRTRWGDKTPEYSRHVDVLHGLFPRAQFINVVRDGRDVALSGFHVHFGRRNSYTAAEEWMEVVSQVRRAGAQIPKDAFVEIRYEDLLADPGRVFGQLIAFLRIDDPDGSLRTQVAASVREELRAENSHKWRRGMSPADQQVFASVAGSVLQQYGYEVPMPLPAAPSRFARAWWRADDAIRRQLDPAYWADNFYKLGVRLRHGSLAIRRRLDRTNGATGSVS